MWRMGYLSTMPFSVLSLHITDQHLDPWSSWRETPERASGHLITRHAPAVVTSKLSARDSAPPYFRYQHCTQWPVGVSSPCRKSPGPGPWAVRTAMGLPSHSPLSHGGWWESPYNPPHRPTHKQTHAQTQIINTPQHSSLTPTDTMTWSLLHTFAHKHRHKYIRHHSKQISSILTQSVKGSSSSMGSSMIWCPLTWKGTIGPDQRICYF